MEQYKITTKQLKSLIHEAVSKHLITEDRESKNMKMARNVVRKYQPNYNAQEIITAIRNDIPNSRLEQCKYLPGITQMFMTNQINGENRRKLNDSLGILSRAHSNEYDNFLNNETAESLINKFIGEVKADYQSDIELHNNTTFDINNNYQIIKIESAEEAAEYGSYTDWCITSSEPSETDDEGEYYEEDVPDEEKRTLGDEMYENYTDGGLGVFYFCLQNGFQNVPKEQGENCPLDEYGLSMIAVSVDEEGKANTITSRWNHDNGGSDMVMSPMDLSKIIGRNFYKTFLPYSKEELYARGLTPLSDVPDLLQQGKSPKSIFHSMTPNKNGTYVVYLHKRANLYNPKTNSLLFNKWLHSLTTFSDDRAIAYFNENEWNYILPDGSLLFQENQTNGRPTQFKNGYASIKKWENGKYVGSFVVNKDGKILNPHHPFNYEFKEVSGNLIITSTWGNELHIYHLDGSPALATDKPIRSIWNFDESGYAKIKIASDDKRYDYDDKNDSEYGLIDINGNLFRDSFFDDINSTSSGYIIVKEDNGKQTINRKDGTVIGWFDKIDTITWHCPNHFLVMSHGKYNWMVVPQEKLLLQNWLDEALPFEDGLAWIKYNNKWNVIQTNTQPLFDTWFDNISNIPNGYYGKMPAIATLNNKKAIITQDGKISEWFPDIFGKKYIKNACYAVKDNITYIIPYDTLKPRVYTDVEAKRDQQEADMWDELKREKYRYDY